MKRLVLVCGPAAIGKSTFSSTYFAEHPNENIFILSADDVRKDLYGGYDKFPPDHNMMIVYNEVIERAHKLAKQYEDLTVILDTTMLFDERRLYFARHLPEFEEKYLYLLKLHDYRLCLERNKQRPKEKWVPENIIMDMAAHYEDPSPRTIQHFTHYEVIYVD